MQTIRGITGAVLAGGQGRRMEGTDKGLMPVANRPLIERVLACLAPQVDQLLINANRNEAEYARYGYPVVADQTPGYLGPLAGIATALANASTSHVLCVPCDAAWLPPDLAIRMRMALEDNPARACAIHDGIWLHPVCVLLPRSLLPDLQDWLAQGQREVAAWLQKQGLVTANYADWPSEYWSINSRDDLEAVEQLLTASPVAAPALTLEGAA